MHAITRRILASAVALAPFFTFAQESWPSHPITLVIPYAAGGVTDSIGRIIAPELAKALGQPVLVVNKAGGNGLIGTDYVAAAKPDGYTLVLIIETNAIAPALYPKLEHDPLKSFAPVTLLARAAQIIVAHPTFAPNDFQSLASTARSSPKPVFYASSGTGTAMHLAMERLKLETGMKLQHVAYKGGGQAITDLLGGQVPLGIIGIAPALQFVKAGKLKPIATTGAFRSPALPEVPTVQEQGVKGFESYNWFGMLAPAGTPGPVVNRLHAETVKVMNSPALAERFAQLPVEVTTSDSPADFGRFFASEISRWAAVVKSTNVKAD